MVDLTVLVRVFNAEEKLPHLLASLRALQVPPEADLELLFVDNQSTDNSLLLIQAALPDLPIPARVVVESRRGSAMTRVRGIVEAKGTFIAFVDDDNLPHVDWLVNILKNIATYPQASAFSGRNLPRCAEPIPDYIQPYRAFYALVDRGQRPFRYAKSINSALPPGAGLIVRRSAVLDVLQATPMRLLGTTSGNVSLKGEDVELLRRMQQAGHEIWYCPDIVLTHELPSDRFSVSYLTEFLKGVARPRHYHRMIQYPVYLWPLLTVAYAANDLRKLLVHWWRYDGSLAWKIQRIFLAYLLISPVFTPRILRMPPLELASFGYSPPSDSAPPLPTG